MSEDGGRTLVAVLQERYSSRHEAVGDDFCQIYVPKSKLGMAGTGDEKQCQLPARVAVDSCGICEAGTGHEIQELCAQVEELDLTKNFITDWSQVFEIVRHIPQLHFLNLTFNHLRETTLPESDVSPCSGITSLVLNGTRISWLTVVRVLAIFPRTIKATLSHTESQILPVLPLTFSLTELHLSLNSFPSIDVPASTRYRCIKKLYLNSCSITDLATLGSTFPSLETLTVIKNNITGFPDESVAEIYPMLNTLNISDNPIASWEEVDNIRNFPILNHLRISGVPFLESMPAKERRQHLISRLPKVAALNGSRVTEVEREDAERAFIRHFMDAKDRPTRYAELEAVYGKLDPLAKVDLSPQNSINMLVKFEKKQEILAIKLLQNVGQLKKLLQNFTGLPPSKFRLFYIEHINSYMDTTELKLLNKSLLSLNMHEGDELEIDRKPGRATPV